MVYHALYGKDVMMNVYDDYLQQLRDQIDKIDDQLLELLNKRAELVLEIGKIKKLDQRRFHVLEREEAIYQRLVNANPGPFPSAAIRPIFREIISASLSLEKTLTIACLGPEATFCHIAAIQQFGEAASYIHTRSIPDIFDEVERGRADYGVVPIENSTEGVVNLTLDMFIESPLHICAEVLLEISQCLLSHAPSLEDITVVYSHPQALAQCYNWLAKNLPHAEIKETFSTAMAAKMAQEQPHVAAIASEFAAKTYGVPVCRLRIEDNPHNFTRFWVIGSTSPGRTGCDKTSLMLSIKDGVGALYNILAPFADNGINLTKIESRPFRKKPWEYIFFIDLEGHQEDQPVSRAIDRVTAMSQFIKVLGSYPKGSRLL
ncbi:MAG: prephenate dehydratase [Desulfobacterota bacterium]|nr:prephenate dehydratase [Thermodesulfobacteriota bacterium]